MGKILYVDDEEDIREVARMSLELDGDLEVALVGEPQRAVGEALRLQPDLIMLDFRMPGMDGLQVLNALRAEPGTAATPVIFLTASVQRQEIQSLLDAGAVDVINKPFDPMALAGQVKKHLPAAAI